MTESLVKKFAFQADDMVIRAQVAAETAGVFYTMSFLRNRIDGLVRTGEGTSAIVLSSGLRIPVRMDHAELEEKIFFTDARRLPVLDLTLLTGADLPAVALCDGARPEKEGLSSSDIEISLFVRRRETQNFQLFTVRESGIDWGAVRAEQGRNGPLTVFPLRDIKGPFGEDAVYVDISRAVFMRAYTDAKASGAPALDLLPQTKPKSPAPRPVRK